MNNYGIYSEGIYESSGSTLFFDTFNFADGAACSIRQLDNNSTLCMEVRRSSDNATQSIGFVNNELDTSSIISFTGTGTGSNAFVSKWYGQGLSASNYIQDTFANQPMISEDGVIITSNGKPGIRFDGDEALSAQTSEWVPEYSFHGVYQMNAEDLTTNQSLFGNWGDRGAVIQFQSDNDMVLNFRGVALLTSSGVTDGNPSILNVLIEDIAGEGTKTMNYRGAQILDSTNGAMTTNTTTGAHIGAYQNQVQNYIQQYMGIIQEIIVYQSYRPTERLDVENNQNEYWNVF